MSANFDLWLSRPSRREFLRYTGSTIALLAAGEFLGRELAAAARGISSGEASAQSRKNGSFKGEEVFHRLMARAKAEKWRTLPIGEVIGKVAKELEGTPYVAKTLDALTLDREFCCVDLTGLDCVTFFESSLDFARMLKKGGHTPADLLAEITFTRYRGGVVGDFSSRLHYTTDWFVDNESKHVVTLLSDLPGAEPFEQKVGIMTSHPENYHQLAAHAELIPLIKQREEAINGRSLRYIPRAKIKAIESQLKTGDIVGVCTNQEGVDIAHTGLIYRTDDGVAHFMDASSKKKNMKVTIEPGPISEALSWSDHITGAMFARPLEPVC